MLLLVRLAQVWHNVSTCSFSLHSSFMPAIMDSNDGSRPCAMCNKHMFSRTSVLNTRKDGGIFPLISWHH
uniref:Putative secreted protein n=1 Tax=Panstrongylus lignarius TaxID=156445 RepID=A0A224Y654_9HEMI